MQVEAIEMNGHYFIPALDNQGIKKKRIRFDIPDEKLKDVPEEKKSNTYKILEEVNKKTDNKLVKMWLKHLPKDFKYKDTGATDRELWYEAVKDKYE